MNYDDFIVEVLENVKLKLGEDYEVVCRDLLKNNSCVFKCLYIIDKYNEAESTVTPAIYLEAWYERYLNGEAIGFIADKLINIYYESIKLVHQFDISSISKDNLQDCIFYRLVNYEANKEQLAEVPYIPYLDFALTFHYRCASSDKSVNSFRISNKLLEVWGLSVEELFNYAEKNMPIMFPDVLTTLSSIIKKYVNLDIDLIEFSENVYVLTNNYGINGATALMYTTKLHKLSEFFNADLYIIPSSIHEIIIIPILEEVDGNNLKNLINEVNYSQVLPEERLSDNLYIFKKDSKSIVIY